MTNTAHAYQDNVATHPDLGLGTTGGSFAFVDMKPKMTAECVDRLVKAGCIILGKANLSVRVAREWNMR